MKIKNLLENKTPNRLTPEQSEFMQDNGYKSDYFGYQVLDDGSIDFTEECVISKLDFKYKGKLPVKFNICKHNFNISGVGLKSTHGLPKEVAGDFRMDGNLVKDLTGVPSKVGGDFSVVGNPLVNLKGSPETVGGGYQFGGNRSQVKNFEGITPKLESLYCWQKNDVTNIHKYVEIGKLFHIKDIEGKSLDILKIEGGLRQLFTDNHKIQGCLAPNIGKGRKGLLAATTKMIEAGFEDLI